MRRLPCPPLALRLPILLILLVLPLPSLAGEDVWSARRAWEAAKSGELILVDLRTPEEWRDTGVPEGAWPINLYDRNFGLYISKVIGNNPDRTIGLICATGGRSAYVLSALRRNGVANVIDVREGVMGSAAGPGWKAAGLPMVPPEEALEAMPADFTAH